MPFLAACTCCGRQSHVPDSARGALVWCSNCSNFYALAAKPKTTMVVPSMARSPKPFVTACSFCGRESFVPGRALGASAWCSKCWNFFTVTKKGSDVAVPVLAASSGPALHPGEPPPPAPAAWWESFAEPPVEQRPQPAPHTPGT